MIAFPCIGVEVIDTAALCIEFLDERNLLLEFYLLGEHTLGESVCLLELLSFLVVEGELELELTFFGQGERVLDKVGHGCEASETIRGVSHDPSMALSAWWCS